MSLKYSVIIPVYNAEETLKRCLDSLLASKRDDAEMILVNDGSSDSSGDICESYAADNAGIKYIAKPNGGVSTARNAGIEAAEGRYLSFVDSDDFVSGDYFEAFDSVLSEYDYDLVLFSDFITDGRSVTPRIDKVFRAQSRQQAFPKIIDHICNKRINSPCRKLYKRGLIEKYNIRFPVGASIAEDRAFNIAYTTHIESYRVSDRAIYYISVENESSLSRKRQTDLEKQFEITRGYARAAVADADIPEAEKKQYFAALNFGDCRSVYKKAKDLHRDKVPFFKRLKAIRRLCRQMNAKHYEYPKTKFCRRIGLPVRLNFAFIIDAMAWVLVRR